jgi:hypothetical protein
MVDYTGRNLVLKFKGTTISTDFREFSNDEEMGITDVSAGSDTARTYLTTLEDGTASVTTLNQTGGTTATDPWNLMDKGAEGTLEWGPEGTAATKPRHYVNAIVTKRSRKFPYDDVVEATFEFQFSGVVTDTTY